MPPPPPPGPPMDPALLKVPTWEDILALMRSEKRRQFKIDVETDSTIAATLSSDMAGLSAVLKAIGETMAELAPMVEQGVLPVDAAKEIIMAVIRRARMGIAVEDAFDKLQAPKPKPDPKAAEAQADMAQVQAKASADIEIAKVKAQLDGQVAQIQQQAQERQNAQEQAMEAQRTAHKESFDLMQAKLDAAVKIIVASIGASKAPDPAVQPGADQTVSREFIQ